MEALFEDSQERLLVLKIYASIFACATFDPFSFSLSSSLENFFYSFIPLYSLFIFHSFSFSFFFYFFSFYLSFFQSLYLFFFHLSFLALSFFYLNFFLFYCSLLFTSPMFTNLSPSTAFCKFERSINQINAIIL